MTTTSKQKLQLLDVFVLTTSKDKVPPPSRNNNQIAPKALLKNQFHIGRGFRIDIPTSSGEGKGYGNKRRERK